MRLSSTVVLIMRLDVQCQALLRLSAVWRWNERKCPRIIQIQTNEGRQETKQKTPMCYACTNVLVVKTFKNSTAERVLSECSQLRHTCDILEYLFKSTAEQVPSECS